MAAPLLATEAIPKTEVQTAPTTTTGSSPVVAEASTQVVPPKVADPKPADPAPKADAPSKQAPANYEFKVPEGMPEGHKIDEKVLATFTDVARELDLPQDKAQLILSKMLPSMHAQQTAQAEALSSKWQEATKADPEIGGAKIDATIKAAKKAATALGTDGLRELLDGPLGNHPDVVRFMAKVGGMLKEDTIVSRNPGPTAVDPNDDAVKARKLYPNSN